MVRAGAYYRVGHRRFYPFGVYSEKKRLEKLNYAHGNAMKNGAGQLPMLITCHSSLLLWAGEVVLARHLSRPGGALVTAFSAVVEL
jgi:hypothetical protein